jgi:RNA polymerase sigma-70 factor, ECF subfamily
MNPQKLTTQELVRLCLETKDEALWKEFVFRFQPLILRVISRRFQCHTGHNVDFSRVDDLVGETFLKICKNDFKALRTFDYRYENALHGFLKKVALNIVEDHFRSRSNRESLREESLEDAQAVTSAVSDPTKSVERVLLVEKVDKWLHKQAEEENFTRDYKIFWLYYRDGLTAKEISENPEFKLSVKGVESTLIRMVKIVRGHLGQAKKASG